MVRNRATIQRLGEDFTGSLMHSWPLDPARGTIHHRYRDFIHLPTKTPRPPLLSTTDRQVSSSHADPSYQSTLGRYDFGFFWTINTGKQNLPCVTETQRYGCIRGSVGRVQTPRSTTLGCEKSYNG